MPRPDDVVADWSAYNATPWGRLRLDLVCWQLDSWLTGGAGAALDAGCGTGELARHLARAGWRVTAVDRSPAMVAEARRLAGQGRPGTGEPRPGARRAEPGVDWLVGEIPGGLPSAGFDLVVAHNVLGYLADPESACRQLVRRVRSGGLISLVVSNALAEPLQLAALHGDLAGALAAARGRRSGRRSAVMGERLVAQTPAEIRRWLERDGVEVLARAGVRVVNDYVANDVKTPERYPLLLELEKELSMREPYAELGTLLHVLGRRAAAP